MACNKRVGNNVGLLLLLEYGSDAQQEEWLDRLATGRGGFSVAITETAHTYGRNDRSWEEGPPSEIVPILP